MTREELLQLSRLVSGELSTQEASELKSQINEDAELTRALSRLERLSAVTVSPTNEDVTAAAVATSALEPKPSVAPRVAGGLMLLTGLVAGLWLAFVERVQSTVEHVQPTVEHVQRDSVIDVGRRVPAVHAMQGFGAGRMELAGVELEIDGGFWWAELRGVEPLLEASHVTRDNPSLENLPMKTFPTPRQTLLAVWMVSGTVVAATPVATRDVPRATEPDAGAIRTVLTDEKNTISIEPGDEVSFEPRALGSAWTLGKRSAVFVTRGEGEGAVVITHEDGGVSRVPVRSNAYVTDGEHRFSVFTGTPREIHIHDVVRWDVGDASLLTVTRDGLAFELKGLRPGETSFRAWDSQGRLGIWRVTVIDRETAPIHLIVGMGRVVEMTDMTGVSLDRDDVIVTRLLGSKLLLVDAKRQGTVLATISFKDGSTKVRTFVVGPLPQKSPPREIPLPEDGAHVPLRLGETLAIPVPGLKRVSQTGDSTPIDVRGQTVLIQPERAGDSIITIETRLTSAQRKFTVEAR